MSTRTKPLRNTTHVAIPSRPRTSTKAMDAWDKDHHHAELKELLRPLHPGFICVLTKTFLGCGGQTVVGVYVAENLATGEKYAAKRLPADDPKVVEDTITEYRLIHNIQHPNLVRYYGIELNITVPGPYVMGPRDELWLIMELCEDYTLRDMAKRNLSFEKIVDIAQQVLRGLHHLHERKIVHRDLKCQNVLVGLDGTIKLADFGLIKKLEGTMTKTNELQPDTGTLRYMAPEVLDGTSGEYKIGRRSDIWSFGCMLPEMLTGKAPEYAVEFTNVGKAAMHIIEGNGPLFPSGLSDRFSPEQIRVLQQVFRRCIVKEPTNRPHATDLLKDFEGDFLQLKPRTDVDELTRALDSFVISNDNRRPVTQPTSFDGGGDLLCSARSLLMDASRMKDNPFPKREVAKFRWLPFGFDRYIMVHTKDAKTFISQFISGQRNPLSSRVSVGILVESLDSDLTLYAQRAKIHAGTLDAMKGHALDTLFVWPNGAARREDMWTIKDQLVRVFSFSAAQLIIVGSLASPEFLKARSRWKDLVQDAKDAQRLVGAPPFVAHRSA
ncbi:probable serine/threonine-protein kinase DDB_G0284251 [Paramacrobiotus metropolitanus]|uniref:probable serine/threonine-protein kinase DDB_G0284251 n=1 Tax=Paramacrobiotus metropolitanus TaxID=2943436 RepID=UPI0024460FEA|nr:probable serine/threonine-protein kinase DDB_G0284251 [Paramacrobiotus metropolitanus]